MAKGTYCNNIIHLHLLLDQYTKEHKLSLIFTFLQSCQEAELSSGDHDYIKNDLQQEPEEDQPEEVQPEEVQPELVVQQVDVDPGKDQHIYLQLVDCTGQVTTIAVSTILSVQITTQ